VPKQDLLSITLRRLKRLPPAKCLLSGVYVILPPIGQKVKYVGQSADIFTRLATHRRTKKWWADDDRVYVLTPLCPEDRLVAETGLILRYRPRYNRAVKIGLREDGSLYEIQFLRGAR
jgi:excinuclease UvrABC nuclease subunit